VDVGQTVAASFQTPTLFLIAKDLTKMQVDTNVSESDIGGIKVGDKASFTVEAYPSQTFSGQVTQVRQAPITVQNVVTYDVVIGVDNPEFKLLPGMTANTRIVTEQRDDVLRVSVSALRFSPGGMQGGSEARKEGGQRPGDRVWVLQNGAPRPVSVTRGLSDGTFVEITGGDLKAGDPVIVNEVKKTEKATGSQRPTLRF
jgi:HlyD family secretion protein